MTLELKVIQVLRATISINGLGCRCVCVSSLLPFQGYLHYVESWVQRGCWGLPLFDLGVDSRQHWHGWSRWAISDYLGRNALLLREGFLRVAHVDSGQLGVEK